MAIGQDALTERLHKIKKLLPEIEAFYSSHTAHLKELRYKYRNRSDLVKLADVIQRLNERDVFGFQLLKEDVRCALLMESLPPEEWQAFFDTKIRPLQKLEDDVVEEEIQIATDAMNQGMPLPQDILEGLKARQQQQVK